MFKYLPNLVLIKLSKNNIQKLDSKLFSHLKNLRYLHMERNKILTIDHNTFKSNNKLEWLYLGRNQLNNCSGKHFLDAPSLILLDLSFCNISQIPHKYFSNLHNLRNLRLNNNSLKTFSAMHLPSSLEILDLSRNSLTVVNVTDKVTQRMTNMEHLDLTENGFVCDCTLRELWLWCVKLSTKSGTMCGSNYFCPVIEFMNCKPQNSKPSGEGTSPKLNTTRSRTFLINYSTEDTDNDDGLNASGDIENEVEYIYDQNSDKQEDEYDEMKQFKMGDDASSVLGSDIQGDGLEGMWSIALYSCIAFLVGLCLIGALVLGVEVFCGLKKGRNAKTSISETSTLRQVRLQLMDRNEERQETRPLSHHQGFDFVSLPTTHVNTIIKHGKQRRSSNQKT